MPRATRETQIYRKDAKLNHNLLTKEEREKLIKVRLSMPILYQSLTCCLAIPPLAAIEVPLKKRRKDEHPNNSHRQPQYPFQTWCPQISTHPTPRPPLRNSAHHFLCLYTITAGLPRNQGQDTGDSVLPSSDARAYSEGCQGIEQVTEALECDFEAGRWGKRWCRA